MNSYFTQNEFLNSCVLNETNLHTKPRTIHTQESLWLFDLSTNSLQMQLALLLPHLLFAVFYFYFIRFKLLPYLLRNDTSIKQKSSKDLAKNYDGPVICFSHLCGCILCVFSFLNIYDSQTNAILLMHSGLLDMAFNMYHLFDHWYFGMELKSELSTHHAMSIIMVVPMNLWYSHDWGYASMIFFLQSSGFLGGFTWYFKQFVGELPKVVDILIKIWFICTRTVGIMVSFILLIWSFILNRHWLLIVPAVITFGYMAKLSFTWSIGSVGVLKKHLQSLPILRVGIKKTFKENFCNDSKKAVTISPPIDAQSFPLVLKRHDKKALILSADTDVQCGFVFQKLILGDAKDAVRVIFDGNYIRMADDYSQCIDVSNADYLYDVSLFQWDGSVNQTWSLNENGTIASGNLESASMYVLGMKDGKLKLVCGNDPCRLIFDNSNWPMTGLRSLEGKQIPCMKPHSLEQDKFLCMGTKATWMQYEWVPVVNGDIESAMCICFDKDNETDEAFRIRVVGIDSDLSFSASLDKSHAGNSIVLFYPILGGDSSKWVLNADKTISSAANPDTVIGFKEELIFVNKTDENKIIFDAELTYQESEPVLE